MRARLIGGFLLCALVTLVSATAGIWALVRLKTLMRQTNADVAANIDSQNRTERMLSSVRSVVHRVHRATAQEEIDSQREEVSVLLRAPEKAASASKGELDRLLVDLLDRKTRMLEAEERLGFLEESCDQMLTIVHNATLEAADEAETRASLLIHDIRERVRRSLEERAAGEVSTGEDAGSETEGGKTHRGGQASDLRVTLVAEEIDRLAEATSGVSETLRTVFEVRSYSSELTAWVKEIFLAEDGIEVETAHSLLTASLLRLRAELLELSEVGPESRVLASLEDLAGVIDSMAAAKQALLESAASFSSVAADVEGSLQELDSLVQERAEGLQASTGDVLRASVAIAGRLQVIQFVLGLTAVLLAVGIGAFSARSIARPIQGVIGELIEGAEHTSAVADQVASASGSLAKMASDEAMALVRTSGTMQELSAMTVQNAGNAEQAEKLMSETLALVAGCKESMARLSAATEEIRRSSRDSARVIQTIDDFAFQTNLLALNAAVEAARAGDAGRGFSVVAEEVRRLARQSAEAARNTDALIRQSMTTSENVVSFAGETASSLAEINDSADRVGGLLEDISNASKDQSSGLQEINASVERISGITQKNAANTQESAGVARELSARADGLMSIVERLEALAGGGQRYVPL